MMTVCCILSCPATAATAGSTQIDLLHEQWTPSLKQLKMTKTVNGLEVVFSCNGKRETYPHLTCNFSPPKDLRNYDTLAIKLRLTSSSPLFDGGGKSVIFTLVDGKTKNELKGINEEQSLRRFYVPCGKWVEMKIPLSGLARSTVSSLLFHMYEGMINTEFSYKFEIAQMVLTGNRPGTEVFDGQAQFPQAAGNAGPVSNSLSAGDFIIGFNRSGGIAELKTAGQKIVAGSAAGGLMVRDAQTALPARMIGGTITQSEGRLIQTSTIEDMQLAVKAAYGMEDGALKITGILANLGTVPRAITLYFAVPLVKAEWAWQADPLQTVSHDAIMHSPIREITQNKYPLSTVTTPDAALSLGLDIEEPRSFRTGFNAGRNTLFIAFDFYLTPIETVTGKSLNSADFNLVLYPSNPQWGFRSGLAQYYKIYPELFKRRTELNGGWTMEWDIKRLSDSEVKAFGGRFHWSADDSAAKKLQRYRSLGVKNLLYLEPEYVQISMTDYALPSEREARERLKHIMDGDKAEWEKYSRLHYVKWYKSSYYVVANGWQEYERRKARSIVASLPQNVNGFSTLDINGGRDWIGENGVGIMAECNLSPDIPGGRGEFSLDFYKLGTSSFTKRNGIPLDGLAMDSYLWSQSLDYDPAHFKYAPCPLTFDSATRKPCLPNYFTSTMWLKRLAEFAHARKMIIFANLGPQFMFSAPYLDVFAKEAPQSSDPIYWRSMAYQKSVTFNPYKFKVPDKDLFYHLLYAIYPGDTWQGAERYQRLIPVLDQLNAAGWEPVTGAVATKPGIRIERYGSNLLMIHNQGAATSATIKLDTKITGNDFRSATVFFGGLEPDGTSLVLTDGKISLKLAEKNTVGIRLEK